MHKSIFEQPQREQSPEKQFGEIPIIDFLKSIRGELHEDLLKQQSFTDFLKDLPTFFDKVVEAVAKKTETIESLNRDLRDYASIKNKFQDFEKRIHTHDHLMREKDKELDETKQHNTKFFNENDELSKRNRELEYQIVDLKAKCEEYTMQLKHAENKSQKLDRDYERAIDENQKKFENSQKDLEHQHKQKVSELEKTITGLGDENQELQNELSTIQTELKKFSKLQMEKRTLQEDHNKLNRSHEEYKKRTLKENIDLQNDITEAERVIDHQRKVIDDLKHELIEAEAEYDEVDNNLKDKESQLNDRSSKLKKLGGEVQLMTKKIVEMNKLSDRLMQENEGMKRELQKTGYFSHQKGPGEPNSNQNSYMRTIPVNWQ